MSEQSSSLLEIKDLGSGVVKITLNDPGHQNTLSEKMMNFKVSLIPIPPALVVF
jgi:enoyl-CoA hydratase/carnithine racemase